MARSSGRARPCSTPELRGPTHTISACDFGIADVINIICNGTDNWSGASDRPLVSAASPSESEFGRYRVQHSLTLSDTLSPLSLTWLRRSRVMRPHQDAPVWTRASGR